MPEEITLPDQWQELPQIKELVEQTVSEVRNSRAAIVKERDVLKEQLRNLSKELAELRDNQEAAPPQNSSKKSPDSEDQERKRLEAQVRQLQERVKTLEAELQTKNARLAEEVLERGIRDAVNKVGDVHKNAWKDVVARGKAVFSLDEQGRPVPRDPAGDIIYGKDNAQPMTFDEWAQKLQADAPHLFKAASGGGSGATGGRNPDQNSKVVISKEDARNPLVYRKAKEKAASNGVELIIQ